MKKILIFLFTAILVLSAAGCSGSGETSAPARDPSVQETDGAAPANDETHPEEEPHPTESAESSEPAAGEFETDTIRLADELYSEDEKEQIQSLQGHITHIDNGGTFPVLLADNKVYTEDYGSLSEKASLPAVPDSITYFDNITIGENLFAFTDGKLSLHSLDGYSIQFADIDFNADTDFVAEIGMSSYFTIVRQENDGYVIDYYESSDTGTSGEFALFSQNPMGTVETSDLKALSVREIVPLRSNTNGQTIYIITDSGDVYCIDNVSSYGTVTVSPSTPLLSDADRLVAPAEVTTYLTVPIYSKTGDSTNLYSAAVGADLFDVSDNFEVTFVLPDGHTPDEVTDVFRAADKLVFVFADGGTYYTDDIEEEDRTSYELIRLDDVSQLMADGSVLGMAGVTVFDDNLYLLLNDGKLYYRALE